MCVRVRECACKWYSWLLYYPKPIRVGGHFLSLCLEIRLMQVLKLQSRLLSKELLCRLLIYID